MAIADNIGFATANSSAISSLSFLLRTYFEHLCRDSINSAINSGRSEVGLEDVSYVFGINGINLTELHDYIQQVQPFTSADAHPLFPVVEPLNVPPSTELVDSSERKDAERETVGKEGAEVDEEGNKHSLHLSNSRSNARTAISQKIFPNFAGAFAPNLGFSVQKIELPLENVYVDHRLANFLSSETVQHTIFEFDCSIAQPLRTKAAISEEQERLLKKKKKKEKRDKEKRMTEETEETTTNDGKRKKHKLKEQSTEDRTDQMPPLLHPPPFFSEEQTYTPPSLLPQQSQEPLKIPKLKIRIPSVVPATIECLPSTSLTEQNLLINEQQISANPKTTEILPIIVSTATTEQNLLINEQQIIANTKTTEVMPKIVSTATEVTTKSVTTTIATPATIPTPKTTTITTEMPKMEKGMKKVEKGTTKAAKETEKVKTMEAKNTPTVVRAKAKVATIKAVKELKKTPIKTTKKEAETLMKMSAPVVVPKKVEAPKTLTKTKAATIPEIPQSMPVATPITNISPIMSVSEDKQQSPAPFSVTSSGRSVKPSKRNFEETEAEKQMSTKGQTKLKTAPKVAKIAVTSKAPKITPTFSTTSRSNNSAEKVKAIAKAVEQIAAAHFSATPSAEIPVENANEGDEEDEPIWICPTCSVAYVEGQEMVACDDCDRWYHWGCVGILIPPPEKAQWYCTECRRKRKKAHQQTTTAGGGSSGSNSRKSSFSVGPSSNVTTAKKQRIAKA